MLLIPGLYANFWRVADQRQFRAFQGGSESLVIGRMLKSRRDGILSAGALTGAWLPEAALPRVISDAWLSPAQGRNQYELYFHGVTRDSFVPYLSQPGGQAMLFSLLDRAIPASPRIKLEVLYVITALLSAGALALIALWFYNELGLSAALCATGSMVMCRWLTVFGRDLWWSLWAFYLPMIVLMYCTGSRKSLSLPGPVTIGILCLIAVLIKCLINGFEYITVTLIMMITPLTYYGLKHGLNSRFLIKAIPAAALGALLAIAVSLTILTFQIAAVQGSLQNGLDHIVYCLDKRTFGESPELPDKDAGSFATGTIRVLYTYLTGTFCDINNLITVENPFISHFLFKIRYYYLIAFFLLMSCVLYRRVNTIPAGQRKTDIAFVITAWISLFAPLSWFVIFRSHSLVHPPLNFIVWQMPFTLFGFALCGRTLARMVDTMKVAHPLNL